MSVVIETTLGDITVDLFTKERPRACQNFLKLCKIKYYNFNLFHTVSRRFIAQTGDPTGSRNGGESIFGVLDGPHKRFFVAETNPRIKHTVRGLISFVGNKENMVGSQFFFTLGDDLVYLDDNHCVFGEVAEGLDVLDLINEAICDSDDRPYQDIRITHTVILDDPLPDLENMVVPSRSPSPSAERLQGGRIAPDEEIDEIAGKSTDEINEMIAEREAKARATILEMVGDLPDADMAPPENVLFVCKLNPVTSDDDLEIIFSRFGKIKSCEVIRDHKSGDSLQYAFIEFEEKKSCEDAYFKMDNVLIDDRRIHVDFSQSVSKVKWMGKGRGVKHFPENGNNKKYYDNKETDREKKSRNYSTHENKHFSTEKYSRSKRYHKEHRDPSPRSRKYKFSQGRSESPELKKSGRRKSRSVSPPYKKHKNNLKSSRSGDRKNISPNYNKIGRASRSTSKSLSPNRKGNSRISRKSRSSSPKGRRSKNRKSRSSSTEIRSKSPEYQRIKNRKSRSDNRKYESLSQKSSKSRRSRSGSTNRRSPRRQNITKRKRKMETPSPEYKKNNKIGESRSVDKKRRSVSLEYKSSKSRRSRSGSVENKLISKKYKKSGNQRISSGSERSSSETPELKKSKNRRSKSPKFKNTRSTSSDSSIGSPSPKHKKSQSKRNQTKSPDELKRKIPKKCRSISPVGRKKSKRSRS